MFIRKQKPSLLYADSAPTRWLRAAVVSLDEKLALACAKHWQSVPVLAVARAADSHKMQRRRD
jgi:hypothetical protein